MKDVKRLSGRLSTVLAMTLASLTAGASPEIAHDWLERMNEAVRSLNYEGRFVYQAGDRLDAMHLIHRVRNGTEREHLVTLTGSPRKFIRDGKAAACLSPGGKPVAVGRKGHERSVSPLLSVETVELTRIYDLGISGEERVAGRPARLIVITPKDALRHGYRIYLDEETALPLRTVTVDEQGQPLAQMMFIDIKTGSDVGLLDGTREMLEKIVRPDEHRTPQDDSARLTPPGWRFLALPEGFRLSAHRRKSLPEGHFLEHFMFSDGLATVSVYIEPMGGSAFDGHSSSGSVQVVGSDLGDYQVTAVGEVPRRTLTMLVQSIRPR